MFDNEFDASSAIATAGVALQLPRILTEPWFAVPFKKL